MRRWLVCLLLPAALIGCTAAPDSSPRRTVTTDEPVKEPVKSVVDHTQGPERLGPPRIEKRSAKLDNAAIAELAKTDPIAFVTHAIERYDREVKGYRVTLEKQERVGGKLLGREVVKCNFREKPFSVSMDWQKGARLAQKTLYVEGENNNQLLVLPAGRILSFLGPVTRDPKGEDAKSSSRYPVMEFGIQIGTRRLLDSWQTAKKRGDLKVLFNGEKKVPELNDRVVWELKRVGYPKPEDDGITESTFYFDTQNWLQVGSVLTGEKDQLIATYYFRDLELNPDFPPETFTRAAIAKK